LKSIVLNTEYKILDPRTEKRLLVAQKNEITQSLIYRKLADSSKESRNMTVLKQIAEEELKHYDICKNVTRQDTQPDKLKVWIYYFLARLFGVTFSLQLMERAEGEELYIYSELSKALPETIPIAQDEIRHERQLLGLIDDERLNYSSDIVRGMNVAIVEITGALAGLTLAFQNSKLVIETVVIVGIIMSLSVMSTEYLAARTESRITSPLKSLVYAGIANLFTIFILLLPYFLFPNIYIALSFTIVAAVFIIYLFSFYISVSKGISVRKRFLEMTLISLGIAALAFGIGLLARMILHIEVL